MTTDAAPIPMSDQVEPTPQEARVAVLHGPGADDRTAIEAYLAAQQIPHADHYPLRRADRLEQDIQAGRVARVVCRDLDVLLQALWEELVDFQVWHEQGVRVELIDPPASARGADWWPVVLETNASWQRDRQRLNRRRTVAGVILGALVIIACAVLMLCMPR